MSKIIIILCGVFFVAPNGIWAECDEYKNSIAVRKNNIYHEFNEKSRGAGQSCIEKATIFNTMTDFISKNKRTASDKIDPLRDELESTNPCLVKADNFITEAENTLEALKNDCLKAVDLTSNPELEQIRKIQTDLDEKLDVFNDELEGMKCWHQRLLIARAEGVVLTAKFQFEGAVDAIYQLCEKTKTNLKNCILNHNDMKSFKLKLPRELNEITSCVKNKEKNATIHSSTKSSGGGSSSGIFHLFQHQ